MKRKLVMAMLSLAVASAAFATPATVQAAGLTQAASPDEVAYGVVSEEDIALLRSLFDLDYYLKSNPDLKALYGEDYDVLFDHFVKCGIFEGRVCNPNFDPSAYASAYGDLKDVFGTDIFKYYEHYLTVGQAENRTITTLEACAKAGITVRPLNNEDVAITPQIVYLAQNLGTTDINSLNSYVNGLAVYVERAATSGGSIIVSKTEPDKAVLEAQGYEVIDTLKIGDGVAVVDGNGNSGTVPYGALYLLIVKGQSGYAAYNDTMVGTSSADYDSDEEYAKARQDGYVLVYETDDYVEAEQRESIFVNIMVVSAKNYSLNYGGEGTAHFSITESEEYPATGNVIEINPTSTSDSYLSPIDSDATDVLERDVKIDGYYTDNEGNWTEFDSEDELNNYYEENNWNYVVEYSETLYPDKAGDKNTEYNVGLEITEGENGNANITFAIYNEEDNFGVVANYEWVIEK